MLTAGPRRCARMVALFATGLLPLMTLSGCSGLMANLVHVTAAEQRSFTVGTQPSIIIDTYNGSIAVKATAENQVEAVVTKTASGPNQKAAVADLNNVTVDYVQEGETVRITAQRTGPKTLGSSGASVELTVPQRAVLSLTTRNGTITTEGTLGDIMARSTNGNLDVHKAAGKLDLETSNGSVTIDAALASVVAQTSNGNVRFSGSLVKGSHALETSNGGVQVMLTPSAQFQFDARTSNGTVTNRFPELHAASGKAGSNRLAGLVGSAASADVDLKLETHNGNISIEPLAAAEAPLH